MRPWPRSLLGRNVLLLLMLVVASQICVVVIFALFIQRPRIDDTASLTASQILLIERLMSALPQAERQRALVEMHGVPNDQMLVSSIPWRFPRSYRMRRFLAHIGAQLPPDMLVRWEDGRARRLWVRVHAGGQYAWIPLPVNSAVDASASWTVIFLLLTLATFPTLGAYLIHRRIRGPLHRLARAAASVERGSWPNTVPVQGPVELATVAEAFNRMVRALADMEAARAVMLAGISHDLRTPLTKLRMALAAPESFDAPIASAERFVEEIDAIVQQFIDFARGSSSEAAIPGDINALLEQLAADYAGLGQPFALHLAPLPALVYRPVSMQRLLMNLMQNAVRYGRVGLSVSTRREAEWVVVAVEDRGPGVAPALLPLLKQPFRRASSSHEKEGTGLGLAIAERIAREHGGRLDLCLRAGGGLTAAVRLPCRSRL